MDKFGIKIHLYCNSEGITVNICSSNSQLSDLWSGGQSKIRCEGSCPCKKTIPGMNPQMITSLLNVFMQLMQGMGQQG